MAMKLTKSDRVFVAANYLLLCLFLVVFLYPIIFVISTSVSDGAQIIIHGNVNILPRGFSTLAYEKVLSMGKIYKYYRNSIVYALGSAIICLFFSSLTAYPLSKSRLPGVKWILKLFTFTLFFGGGLIPFYLLMRQLHFANSWRIMIIPACLNVWNIIIFRTFFRGLPGELEESAYLDGANDFRIFWQIILPLSKPIIATFTIFAIVGAWNDFFTALIYLNNDDLMPLQIYLRRLLIQLDAKDFMVGQESLLGELRDIRPVRSATIVVSTLPIMMIYPFFQKYFAKGVIVGSLKG
jgi:putative aldouronate transport system permease protein